MRRFAVVGATILLLAGCTAPAAPQESEADHVPVLIPSGVVATAELTTVAGEPFGEVTIIRDGEGYRLDYPDLAPLAVGGDIARPEIALSDSPFTTDECGDANIWQIGFGDDFIKTVPIDENTFPSGDWSFLTYVLVVGFVELGGDGCTQPILATGDLVWDQPVVRPWVDPEDSGSRTGATGTVDGTTYTTASGDIWSEIAARFGIDGDDLEGSTRSASAVSPAPRTTGSSSTSTPTTAATASPAARSRHEKRGRSPGPSPETRRYFLPAPSRPPSRSPAIS
jgi:hypothetical protein